MVCRVRCQLGVCYVYVYVYRVLTLYIYVYSSKQPIKIYENYLMNRISPVEGGSP